MNNSTCVTTDRRPTPIPHPLYVQRTDVSLAHVFAHDPLPASVFSKWYLNRTQHGNYNYHCFSLLWSLLGLHLTGFRRGGVPGEGGAAMLVVRQMWGLPVPTRELTYCCSRADGLRKTLHPFRCRCKRHGLIDAHKYHADSANAGGEERQKASA